MVSEYPTDISDEFARVAGAVLGCVARHPPGGEGPDDDASADDVPRVVVQRRDGDRLVVADDHVKLLRQLLGARPLRWLLIRRCRRCCPLARHDYQSPVDETTRR